MTTPDGEVGFEKKQDVTAVTRGANETTAYAPIDAENPTEAPDLMAPVSRRLRSGALWSGLNSVLMRIASVALMIAAARIVAPEQFGVFALAITVHTFLGSLADFGVSSAIARKDLNPDEVAPTATSISIAASLVLGFAMLIFAADIAQSLGSEDAAGPLRVLSIGVVLIGPFAVPAAQLQRNYRQNRVFLANAISFVPSSIVRVWLFWSDTRERVLMRAVLLPGRTVWH